MALVQRRIGLLFACSVLALLLAAGRELYLGVVRSASLRRDARSEQVSVANVPAPRGTITDRTGAALAISEPAYEISADPELLRDPVQAAGRLAAALGVPQEAVLAQLSRQAGFVYLAHAANQAHAQATLALKITGVEATPVMRRVYPGGALAAQVLGAVGAEGEGLAGLEDSENSLLAGTAGERRTIRDALGQSISVTTPKRDRAGATLKLTIDANVQQRTEEVLGAIGTVFHPKDATAIVIEPRTGAVVAMADWPTTAIGEATELSTEELQNRAVSFNYEPGSTFKVVAMAGALQQGLITPQTPIEIPESLEVGGRVIHDAEEHPAETLTASQVLAQSSNIGAVKIAQMQGPDRFNEWVHAFGFGARTGIELPGEERGAVPNVSEYSGVSMGNLPFGQGELVTPIQVATAYAAIADGGILRQPHVIAAVNGRRAEYSTGRRILSPGVAAQLREMLRGPLQPGGTASEVTVPGYEIAGKTGTANKVNPETHEYSTSAYVASFVGFAPVHDPRLLAAVVVDEPHAESIFGGQVAAPGWGQIMSFALPYLGVAPE